MSSPLPHKLSRALSCCLKAPLICALLALSLITPSLSCTSPEPLEVPSNIGALRFTVSDVEAGLILPGAHFEVRGEGFLESATPSVHLSILGERHELNATLLSSNVIEVIWPVELGLQTPEGDLVGALDVELTLAEASGSASAAWRATLSHKLTPVLGNLSPWSAPQTPRPFSAQQLLREGEGESLLALEGALTTAAGRRTIAQSVSVSDVSADRTGGRWVAEPNLWGVLPGEFQGVARLINQAHSGVEEGPLIEVSFSYRAPQLTGPLSASVSRGQGLSLTGWGFLGGETGGFTLLTFNGVFSPSNELLPEQTLENHPLQTTWRSGEELRLSLSPRLDDECEGEELGAMTGFLIGEVTPSVIFGEEQVSGPPLAVELHIAPTKQVVFLSFLPAFTDSLRLFGLRNVSGRVIEAIIEVVERDYQGINLELRRERPTDFDEYSVVEVGGPDPNAQELFGLDNTTGLDVCNQRLNDVLGGRNADSGGTFGGIFVESFLNLSPRRGDNPLADPLFDELFDPVINEPARAIEEGARAEVIERAVRALAHLVGNTLSHELGHSLGLPMYPGCGQYHNAPGELQIMDCGRDRPFLERVGLDPRGAPQWTYENRLYLERILPLR